MIVYGSKQCPDTAACLKSLDLNGCPYDFRDIEKLPFLKEFLHYRDSSALFDAVRAAGGVGIPLIVKDDGSLSFDLE